jgi:hypothetical protein
MDGGAEKPQRHRPRFKWTALFAWFEWATEWVAYWLSRWALIQVLQSRKETPLRLKRS